MENKNIQLNNETPQSRTRRSKASIKKSRLPKALILLFISILIIAAAIFAGIKSQPKYHPDKLLKQYINAVLNEEWGTAYDVMTINGAPLISRERFIEYCTENPNALSLTASPLIDFEIDEYSSTEDLHYFDISCLTEDKSTETRFAVVEKISDGFMGFDKYAVQPFANCIVDFNFHTADGTRLYVDGTELAAVTETGTDPIYNTEYTYKKFNTFILFGSYKVKAVNPYCDETEQNLTVDENSMQSLDLELKANESSFNSLCDLAGGTIAKIYDGVINDNLDKEALPLSSSFAESGLNSLVSTISSDLYKGNENYKITNFEMTSVVPKNGYSDITLGADSCARADISLTFDYNYTAESPNYNGGEYKEEKSDSGYSHVQLVLENGEWKINSITQRAWF